MKRVLTLLVTLLLTGCSIAVEARPGPHLNGYTPQPIASATPQTIKVTGSSFLAGMTTSIGMPSNVSASVFTLTATFNHSGGVSLTVRNPDGKVSNVLLITVQGAQPPPPPPALTTACAPSVSAIAPSGATGVSATFNNPTPSGGVAPIVNTCTPSSGSIFPVGWTLVVCQSQDAVSQLATCDLTVTVTAAPLPPLPTSPNCTVVTPGVGSVTMANADVWALNTATQTTRNGTWVGSGLGSKLENFNNAIYVLGIDSAWWTWGTTAWSATGQPDPCVTVPPVPVTTSITIAWDYSDPADGFDVFVGVEPGVYTRLVAVDSGSARQVAVDNLTPGVLYFFVCRTRFQSQTSGNSVPEISGIAK